MPSWKVPSLSVPSFKWGWPRQMEPAPSRTWDKATLQALSRRELQVVAKQNGIAANLASSNMIDKLLNLPQSLAA
eukprot:1433625-Rhodomonas_salina.1